MQVPKYVYGSIAPTFTAVNEDGTLDDKGQRNLLDYMLQSGSISAFFLRSGMGQMFAFEMEDVKQMAKNACAYLSGKAPSLMGCSGIWDRNYDRRPDPKVYLAQAIELSKFAEDAGADAVVHAVPEALVPAAGESYADMYERYFTAISDAISIPIFIYQTPGTRPEYMFTPESLARIAGLEKVVAAKVSSSDGYYLFDLIRAVKDKTFGFIVGAETAFYAGIMAGARACIGQGTSLNPQIIRAIVDRYVAGDIEGAVEAQEATNALVRECPNAVDFFKMYVTEKGYPVGRTARSPKSNPYAQSRERLSPEAYKVFKRRYETILAKYT